MWAGVPAKQEERRWFGEQLSPEEENQDVTGQDQSQGATILYRFYKKPMASRCQMLQRSAITEKAKVSTAVSEYRRRWKNTSRLLPATEYERITADYSDELAGMGYSEPWREEAIRSCLTWYEKIIQEGTPMNRSGASSQWARRAKTLTGAKTWFQVKPRHSQEVKSQTRRPEMLRNQKVRKIDQDPPRYESVWFIPHTPDGLLKKELTAMEERLGFSGKVKYVESLGSKISQILCNKNPWKEHCGRVDCFPCMSKGGTCMTQNITYKISCQLCAEEGRASHYIGESARTAYDRGGDHLKALNSRNETNPLVEHWVNSHQGVEWKYSMKVTRIHDSALQRQVEEGFSIGNYKGDTLLNRKGEWGNNLPPKLIVEDSTQERAASPPEQVKQVSQTSRKVKISTGGAEIAQVKKRPRMAPQDVQEGTIPSKTEPEPTVKKSKVPKYIQQKDGPTQSYKDASRTMQGKEMLQTGMISSRKNIGGVSANPRLSKPTKGQTESLNSTRGQELKDREGKHEDWGGQTSQNAYKGAGKGRPITVEQSNQFRAAEEEVDCKLDPPDKRSEDPA